MTINSYVVSLIICFMGEKIHHNIQKFMRSNCFFSPSNGRRTFTYYHEVISTFKTVGQINIDAVIS